MKHSKEPLPHNNEFSKFANLGLRYFVIGLAYIAFFFMIGFIVLVGLYAVGSVGMNLTGFASVTFGIFAILVLLLIIFAIGLIGVFFLPASTYLLLSGHSIVEAINPQNTWKVVRKGFLPLLLLMALNSIVAMILGFAIVMSIFTCCFAIVLIPFILTLGTVYTHYLMGVVFRELKSKNL
jgi:hypothetical protein